MSSPTGETTAVDVAALEREAMRFRERYARLADEIARVVVGQRRVVELLLTAMVCGGHVLLEGAPGLGKTLLVRTLSSCLQLSFARVQCTPDLMPADIIGTNVLVEDATMNVNTGASRLEFERGPIFANIVLADEVNRATPKTQSAFLEAMEERRVTVFGRDYLLDEPFFVMATQNPIEMEGTYPLPEAQLDRFFFKINVEYPDLDDLSLIMDRTTAEEPGAVGTPFGAADILEMRGLVRRVKISEEVKRYALRLTLATHSGSSHSTAQVRQYVRYGASPRAAQAMILAAKASALVAGRYNVAVEDIRAAAVPALNHRIILNFEGEVDQADAGVIVADVLERTPGPGERA